MVVGGAVQGEALVPLGNFFCPLHHILKFKYLFKSTSLVTYEGWPDVKVLDQSPVFLIKGGLQGCTENCFDFSHQITADFLVIGLKNWTMSSNPVQDLDPGATHTVKNSWDPDWLLHNN